MDLEKIQAFRDAQAQQKKEAAATSAAQQNANSVASTVTTGSLLGAKASTEIKQTVQSSGDKVASEVEKVQTILQAGQDSVAQAINNLMLATVLTKDPKLAEAADNVAKLLSSIADAGDKFGKSNLNLLPVANKELAGAITGLTASVREKQDQDLSPEFDRVVEALNSLDVKPVVNVPKSEIRIDVTPITDAIAELKKALKPAKIDIPKVDFKEVINGLNGVRDTISGLSFPVPNYVLPFKDSTGAATQLVLNSGGTLPIANASDNLTTGTIIANGGTVIATAVSGMAGWSMAYYGTYTTGASLTMEVSFDGGTTYASVRMLAGTTGTLGYVVTIAAVVNSMAYFTADIPAGATHLRVRCSAWAAPIGTINVIIGQTVERYATPTGAVSITAGTVTTLTTLTNITNWGNIVDNAAFTDGTTRLMPGAYIFDEVAGTALTEDDAAAARIDSKRAQVGVIEDATTRGRRATVTAQGALLAEGTVASGIADNGNPFKIGGKASTSTSTAVLDGQRVDAEFSKTGKQVVIGTLREQMVNQITTITSSTAETTIVTADATYLLDVYGLIITNTSATATKVTIKDATAGTTRMVFQVPATDTRGFMLPVDSGHKQAAVNNNWTATCGTSVADIVITALVNKRL